jgi:hypothetical protein
MVGSLAIRTLSFLNRSKPFLLSDHFAQQMARETFAPNECLIL